MTKLSALVAPPFYDLHKDVRSAAHTHYWIKGGRGSTKSSFVSVEIILGMMENPGTHAVCYRKVKDTLRDSIYAQLLWAIDMLGVQEYWRSTESPMRMVYTHSGQQILFRGLDRAMKSKSIKPKTGYFRYLWFEELDEFAGMEEVRSVVQSVMRGGNTFTCFCTYNPPRNQRSWVNDEVLQPKPDRRVHHSDYRQVHEEWLGEQFIIEAEHLRDTKPELYSHEYLGEVTGTGTEVFYNLVIKEIDNGQIAAFDRVYRGIDWGWYPDPFAFNSMCYQANERRLYIYDEIEGNRFSNNSIALLLLQHGVSKDQKITADSGGEGPKSIGDFKARGFYMRPAIKGPGSVEYSMKWLQSLTEIIVDPVRCPKTAREFREYEFEQSRTGEVVSGYPDRNNHHIDAVRYALEEIWRRKGQ